MLKNFTKIPRVSMGVLLDVRIAATKDEKKEGV